MAEKQVKKVFGKEVKTACIVLAAAIIVSVPLGFTNTMYRMYDKVAVEFQNGAEKDGLSIQADLDARASAAYNLATVAKRYMDESSEAVQSVLKASKDLNAAKGPAAKYEANEELGAVCTRLYETLGEMELSEKDEQYRQSLYAEMKSRNVTMANDPYNRLAEKYNEKLERFPANLLGKLFGVEKAELFQ